jgi:hypothetical protein
MKFAAIVLITLAACLTQDANANHTHATNMNEAAEKVSGLSQESKFSPEFLKRFWDRVEKKPDGCWIWTGTKVGEYGGVKHCYKMLKVHRVSWEIHNGTIPRGEGHHGTCVCHRCDVKFCVNPAHLFLGTVQDNVMDMVAKGRQAMGDAQGLRADPSRAARGIHQAKAKLTDAQVLEMRAIKAANPKMTYPKLASMFGVVTATARCVALRITWTHI